MLSPRAQGWLLALVATFTMAVSYVDRQVLAVLAPTVTKALRLTETDYGLLASAFSLAYLVGAPLAGRLIDRVGARRGLLGAVVLWSIVSALHALAPGFGALFVLRIALGLAEAPSFPGAAQTVHRALPPAERARGLGVLFTGSSIGAMIAAPLASAIDARWGFRAAMVVTAVVGLVWVPIWLATAWSPAGRALLDRDVDAPSPGATTIEEAPPSTMRIVRDPAVLRALLVVLATAPSIAFVLLWGAKFLVTTHGLGQADVGRYLWLPPLCFDAGAIVFGDRASRGRAGASPRGPFAVAAVMLLAIGLMPWGTGPWSSLAIAGVALAGGGGLFAMLTSDMLSRVPPSAVSLAGGCTAAAQSLAYVVANPLIGRSVESSGSYAPALVALALWSIPGNVAWLLWRLPDRAVPAPKSLAP